MILVLIGYRGTGKTVVGELLAKRLQMPCISIDEEIVRRAGRPIKEIVDQLGWPAFRDMESELVREFSGRDDIIVDTGGGVIEREENIAVMKGNACIFWLKASVDTIVSRIQDCTERPSLTVGKTFTEEVAEVLERRDPKYEAAADYVIDTEVLTPEQIADQIVSFWTARQQAR